MDQPIYHHPEEYDLEHARRESDVDFYLRLAKRWRPKRILELGCGSGRITIPLATSLPADKAEVVGLDRVPEMLETARKKSNESGQAPAQNIRWVFGDMRTWRDEQSFDLIIAPCGALSHLLTLDDQLAAWKTAFDNLRSGGRMVADVAMAEFTVFAESMQIPPRAILEIDNDTSQSDRAENKRLLRYKTVRYHAADQRASVRYLYDEFRNGDEPTRFLSDYEAHVYYPRELGLLFRITGFEIESAWGDYRESPLRNRSRSLIMAGRKP